MIELLKDYNVLLVSGSPRRKELLEKLGIKFEVKTIDVEENYPADIKIEDVAQFLANKKYNAFIENGFNKDDLIITADTIVIKNNEVLGKPIDLEGAKNILISLSDSWHNVITGVCIGNGFKKDCFSVVSEVFIEPLESSEIDYYVNTYKVLDKAGAYGIQDWIGLAKISKIKGSYFNIMGLPTQMLYEKLKIFLTK